MNNEPPRTANSVRASRAVAKPYTTPFALRALAFVWVVVNVYFIAVRLSMPALMPITLLPAAAVTILTSWAAVEGKRWGWMAMVFLVVASLADLLIGLAIVTVAGAASDRGSADLIHLWTAALSALGLGPTYGMIVVTIWIISIVVLLAPGVRRSIFANKREHLTRGQAALAAALLIGYLLGLASVGSTAAAGRILRERSGRSDQPTTTRIYVADSAVSAVSHSRSACR